MKRRERPCSVERADIGAEKPDDDKEPEGGEGEPSSAAGSRRRARTKTTPQKQQEPVPRGGQRKHKVGKQPKDRPSRTLKHEQRTSVRC